jgi:hypothetical protein
MALTSFWGHPANGEQSSLQVTLYGQAATAEWNAAWPYSACRGDPQDVWQSGGQYVPLTHTCYEVAQKLATLRYYNISIISSNVSATLAH